MRKKYILSASLIAASLLPGMLTSCHDDKPEVKEEEPNKKMTVLLYAVVSDLDLQSDKREILEGASNINLDENKLFVYQVEKHGLPQLLELTRDVENNPEFQVVKVYDRDLYSTDPKRISGVIDDVMTMSPSNDYGLIFWSHGTGWTPNFSNHGESEEDNVRTIPAVYSFGSDTDVERDPYYTDYTDIDELADAIPDDVFRYIWFDVCYMGGIETAYQFRNKCEYYIAMPTEDAGNGMPYDLTLPYLLRENPDCIEAAKEFFDYYASGKDPYWNVATIGVCYQPAIEKVADYCKQAYQGASTPTSYGLQVYSRRSNGPFYDFGQYTRRKANSNEFAPSIEEFEAAMADYVVYKAATQYDFANREIVAENYSGLSCHLYDPTVTTEKNSYYQSLDWFKRVYE